MKISQKLYVRVALSIAVVALLVSLISSLFSYFSGLDEKKVINYTLVKQIAQTMQKTAAISAYLSDVELGTQISNGLVGNDLVKGVSLKGESGMVITQGNIDHLSETISLKLMHPFIEDSQIGELILYPDNNYILKQAKNASEKEFILMMVHSIIITFFVSLLIHKRLSRPLQNLTDEFAKIDHSMPQTMQMLNVKKGASDEIGRMVIGINALMRELQTTLGNERELRIKTEELEGSFRLIFEQASAGVCLLDAENMITTYNPAFAEYFTEAGESEIPSLNFPNLFNNADKLQELLTVIRDKNNIDQLTLDIEFTLGNKTRWMHCLFAKLTEQRNEFRQSQENLIEVILHDVTERAERELQTRFEADHDALTNLYSRGAGERELTKALSHCIEKGYELVLMMIDLDKFKPVNDSLGHEAGDKVLIEIAKRINNRFCLNTDTCIRWGGDEFVIARKIEFLDERSSIVQANNMLTDIELPIFLNEEQSCNISASIGIVIGPKHGAELQHLMSNADNAMYQVKESGRGKVSLFKN